MTISTSIADGVATVTLDWPERRNSLGPEQAQALSRTLDEVGADPAARVVVLTGNGAFSAGGDLPAIMRLVATGPDAVRDALYDSFHAMIRSVVGLPKPILSAVDGPAIGLGMDLALACDRRFVGATGWLLQGWARIGLIPGTGGELLLRRLAPASLWSLLTRNEPIRAQEAAQLGLGESVEDAYQAALGAAAALATLPTATLQAYVRLNRHDLREALEPHLTTCLVLQTELLTSPEFSARASRILDPQPTS